MELASLGDVEFNVVTSEEPERRNDVTEKAVEEGADIHDHIRPLPITLAFSGIIAGNDAAQKYEMLGKYRERGEILTYSGRNILENMVIESLSTTHDAANKEGFAFDITLKQVRLVSPVIAVYVAADPADPQQPAGADATKSQAKPVENKGTQQSIAANIEENTVNEFSDYASDKLPPYVA